MRMGVWGGVRWGGGDGEGGVGVRMGVWPQLVRCGTATFAPAAPAPRPSLRNQFSSSGLWPVACLHCPKVPVPASVAGVRAWGSGLYCLWSLCRGSGRGVHSAFHVWLDCALWKYDIFRRMGGWGVTGLRERGNHTGRSTGRSGRQNAATRRNMRREDRVTVQGPVKKQQPDGMSHRGWGGETGRTGRGGLGVGGALIHTRREGGGAPGEGGLDQQRRGCVSLCL